MNDNWTWLGRSQKDSDSSAHEQFSHVNLERLGASGTRCSRSILTTLFPDISVPDRQVLSAGKAPLSSKVFDALPSALEKANDRFICMFDRTLNRIRSPDGQVASGPSEYQ